MKNLGKWTGTTDINTTNRIQEMEERILRIEDTIEEMDTAVKGNAKSKKIPDIKYPGNLRHYEKTKPNSIPFIYKWQTSWERNQGSNTLHNSHK